MKSISRANSILARHVLALVIVPAVLVGAGAPAAAQEHPHDTGGDSAAVAAVIHSFHSALENGDTAAVKRLLSERVRVLEGGGIEDRDEYLGHHLSADMAFAAAVPADTADLEVFIEDDVAWAVSTSRRQGRFRERAIDSQGAELMVLAREDGEWRIVAVHWSSR